MPALLEEDATARERNPAGRDYSEALARGIRILRAFNSERRAMSLSDLSRIVSLPRATVRRSLITLVELGYVVADGKAFSLSPKVLMLASAYLEASVSTSILQPACERLASEHGEIFSIATMDEPDAVMVAYARARSMYTIGEGIGLRIPAHCTAVGRVLLSGLGRDAREAFLERHGVSAVTRETVTDRGALSEILARVEEDQCALVEDEAELGFRSLAVPVRDRGGRIRFAINVGMATQRCAAEEARERLVPVLRREADRLSQVLI